MEARKIVLIGYVGGGFAHIMKREGTVKAIKRQQARNWKNLCISGGSRIFSVNTTKSFASVLNCPDIKGQNSDTQLVGGMRHWPPVWSQKQYRHWSDIFPSQEQVASLVFFSKHLAKLQLLRTLNHYLLLICNHWHPGSVAQDPRSRGLPSDTLLQKPVAA